MGFRDSEFICFFDMELMAIANSYVGFYLLKCIA